MGIDSIIVSKQQRADTPIFKIYTRAMAENKEITLEKKALSHLHFQRGSYLFTQRYLNPMFAKKDTQGNVVFTRKGRIACLPDNGKAFDFEYFYKDGKHVVRKEDYDNSLIKPLEEVDAFLPDLRCKSSKNKIQF